MLAGVLLTLFLEFRMSPKVFEELEMKQSIVICCDQVTHPLNTNSFEKLMVTVFFFENNDLKLYTAVRAVFWVIKLQLKYLRCDLIVDEWSLTLAEWCAVGVSLQLNSLFDDLAVAELFT